MEERVRELLELEAHARDMATHGFPSGPSTTPLGSFFGGAMSV